jgi:hypothetical protein
MELWSVCQNCDIWEQGGNKLEHATSIIASDNETMAYVCEKCLSIMFKTHTLN